ncbi:MAG TPA: ECF transporter S component [Chloroflexota bacterium]|nr:ECF transporter S component [Chloroflexota bacterium]
MSAALGVAGAGALVALVAFFLPWVRYQQATYSGFDLALAIAPALAGVAAGGLKGFHLALHAVPVLAAVTLVCLVLAARQGRSDAAARLLGWAAAASGAGLAITLLFAASGLLSGTPGTQFAPGLLRTDAAVPTNVARSLNAGGFLGLGAAVLLACAGFAAAAVGSALAAGRAGSAGADDLRAGRAGGAWRTQDYVFLAVLAIVSGALYWWWLQPYSWVVPLVPGAGQVAQEAVFGVWFLSGLLGGYVIRRPGAAVLANTLAALAEVLLGAPAGPILVVTGLMQALGPELVFAATGYRRWGWSVMIVAGIAAGLVALPWNWFRLGYFALQPGLQIALIVARIAGGALAGVLAKVIGDLLASTGALSYFPIGRERMREV